MPSSLHTVLTRRERQIMDILFRRGRATAAEVMAELPGDPSYSTVRTQLRVLEEKGHARHEEEGLRYVYMWRRTAQPGLWFTAGSLAQCRIFSRYLALQIKALEEGLLQ